ncbi:MAG: MBL fold metallo-hydrolase [archaeon]|nr:MBL fold metallo-hydrolase [archaeon]
MIEITEEKEEEFFLKRKSRYKTICPGIHVNGTFGNLVAIETDLGIVHIDTGDIKMAPSILTSLRKKSDAPIHTIIYSHGHNGYNFGADTFIKAAKERNEPRPRIIAHENLPPRYRRYIEVEGLQNYLSNIQFQFPNDYKWSSDYVFPDVTFKDSMLLEMGNRKIEVLWAPSETDDSIALWLPEEKVLYGGSSVIITCSNVGTPLRTQRDAVRWANSLDKLMALQPEIIIPSYGPVIKGVDQIQKMLGNMAEGLRYLRHEVVKRMNQRMTDVEIIHDISYPDEYFKQPWSSQIYGCPDWIVRDIYRSENGWWDRNTTNLHPEKPDLAARAIFEAISDPKSVLENTRNLRDSKKIQLALHVVDLLALASGKEEEILEAKKLKSELLRLRSEEVPSIIAQNLYLGKADELDKIVQDTQKV